MPQKPMVVRTFATFAWRKLNWTNESKFFSEAVGSVVGPYTKNGQIQMARILDRSMVPDEAAKCRHILLDGQGRHRQGGDGHFGSVPTV